MSSRAVSEGATDKVGDRIGYMGNTGDATGQHLHFDEVHNGNWESSKVNAVDPINYIGTVAPTPEPEPSLKIVDIKPNIGLNSGLGVIRSFESSVIRKGPGASYPINKEAESAGVINLKDQYKVYGYQNGWYQIATNAWAKAEYNNFRPSLDLKIKLKSKQRKQLISNLFTLLFYIKRY